LLALALRVSLYHVETSDYTVFVSQWYDFIQTHGGFAALKYNFSNYNVPYLYLLALLTYLPIPKLIAIKTLSVVFDGVLGLFTYLIISLKYKRSYAAIAGALVIVFAPTIFINSAAWGQCDAIYTAFCMGSLYFLLKERPAWACVFFAFALSFKLQAIFFLPVLLMLLLKRKLPLKYLVLIPLVFLLMLVPAFIAGHDAQSLLTIYAGQVSTGGAGGGQFNGGGNFNNGAPGQFNRGGPGQFNGNPPGQFNGRGSGQFNDGRFGGRSSSSSSLTLNAPSFYQWLPANAPAYWKWVGILLAGAFIAFVGTLLVASKKQLTSDVLLKVALVFALAIPFLLPEMHERYFYLADVLSIIYAFYFPRYFYIAVITQLCSLLSYAPYLLNTQIVSLAYVAFAVLVITIITSADLVRTLYPKGSRPLFARTQQ
jgi:Gpi18-like mannosyltransferase